MNGQTRRGIILDYVLAMILLVVLNGFVLGTSDDMAFLPWAAKAADPALYTGDPRFGAWPIAYYYFHILYLRLVLSVFSFHAGLVLSILLSWFLLLVGLCMVAQALSAKRVPATLFAVLLTGYFNGNLSGGYFLFASGFSTHYLAFPLVLIALALMLRQRILPAVLPLLLAGAINPRVGVFGLASLAIAWIALRPPGQRRTLGIAAAIFSLLATMLFVVTAPASAGGMPFEEIARAWIFIRSPAHYVPASWPLFAFMVLGLTVIAYGLAGRLLADAKARAVWISGAVGLAFILAGLVNSAGMVVPLLVLANPFEFGPNVLAILYVLMGVWLVARMQRGLLLSSLLVLAVPDLQTRLMLFIAATAADIFWLRDRSAAPSWRPRPGEAMLLCVQGVILLGALLLLHGDWGQQDYRAELMVLPLLAMAGLVVMTWSAPLKRPWTYAVPGAFAVMVLAMELVRANPNPMRDAVTPDTAGLCSYVTANTDKAAIFVTPPDMYDFQYYCRRASFAGFVHMPLSTDAIPGWIARLRQMGVMPADLDLARLDHVTAPDFAAYGRMDAASFRRLAAEDSRLRYVLVTAKQSLALPLRYQNTGYRLYALTP